MKFAVLQTYPEHLPAVCNASFSIDLIISGNRLILSNPYFSLSLIFYSLLMLIFDHSDSFCNLDIPIINVELDDIFDEPKMVPYRNSVAVVQPTPKTESEEESESTIL